MVPFRQSLFLCRHSLKLESYSFHFIMTILIIMSNSIVSSQTKNSATPISSTPVVVEPRSTHDTNRHPTSNKFVRERMLHFDPDFQDEMTGIQQLVDDGDSPSESELYGFENSIQRGTDSFSRLSQDEQKPLTSSRAEEPPKTQGIPSDPPAQGKVPSDTPKNPILSGETSVDLMGLSNANAIIGDKFLKPISSIPTTSPSVSRDEASNGGIMGNRNGNSKNSVTAPSSSRESSPSVPSLENFNYINGEDILLNETKDCKETQFGEPTPARSRFSSVTRRQDEDKVQRADPPQPWRNIPERLEFPALDQDHQPPPSPRISPYSTGLFKPLKEISAPVVATPALEPGIVTVVGIFLVSILTFAALMSQGDFNHSENSEARIIDPIQESWDRSFQTHFYNPGISRQRQNVHIPRRPPHLNLRPRPPPFVWF